MQLRTGSAILLGLSLVFIACSKSRSPNDVPAAVSAVAPPPAEAPTLGGTGAGAGTLPSLPRADWPCRAEGTQDGRPVTWTYDYTGAPASCRHLPDQWQPGCPREIDGADVAYTYEGERVTGVRHGRSSLTVGYGPDGTVLAVGDTHYRQAEGEVVLSDKHDVPNGRVVLDGERPSRIETGRDEEGKPVVVEEWEYDAGRPSRNRIRVLGASDEIRFVYQCGGATPPG